MSYPINQSITYTALAVTQGLPLDTFTYSWTFDDATIGSVASLSKTWSTSGIHSATVTAVDTLTGGSATVTRNILVNDFSAFAWTSAASKIIPSTSGSVQFYSKLVVSGTKLINTHDYYSPDARVSYDTATGVRTEVLSSVYPGIRASASILLTSGPKAGQILTCLNDGNSGYLAYGFLDPTTLVTTIATRQYENPPYINPGAQSWMAAEMYDTGTVRAHLVDLGNGKILGVGRTYYSYPTCQLYDIATSTWTIQSPPPYNNYLDYVKIGSKILFIRDNSTATDTYDMVTGAWMNGPALPGTGAVGTTYPSGGLRAGYIDAAHAGNTNGLAVLVSAGISNSILTWDGISTTWTVGPTYPLSSVGWTSTSGCMFIPCADGMLLDVYAYGNTNTVQRSHAILYQQNYFISVAWNGFGWLYRSEYCNGRAWIADNSGNLYYSTPV